MRRAPAVLGARRPHRRRTVYSWLGASDSIAFGDSILGEPETVTGDDLLAFAGIAAPELRVYPVETHLAEKLHAYTLPRTTPNTRRGSSPRTSPTLLE
jgi:nucleotidyltransferase AbiEii toxin of type IV toxin-antitoxin system